MQGVHDIALQIQIGAVRPEYNVEAAGKSVCPEKHAQLSPWQPFGPRKSLCKHFQFIYLEKKYFQFI